MGGKTAEPVVTRFVRDWGAVILIYTDGLTKHVSDEQIEKRLSSMQNARETSELLLQGAFGRGRERQHHGDHGSHGAASRGLI